MNEHAHSPAPEGPVGAPDELADLLRRTAQGDESAFEQVYDRVSASVYGMVLHILRDPAQSEEVAQEALIDVWRGACRYQEQRGSAKAWVMTMAHRRAVDRVRSEQAGARRHQAMASEADRPYDSVEEEATTRLEGERVRRCLSTLTDLQRQAVRLAYYGGYTYREVAKLLESPLGTVKTRMRDGLIRLRDCLGVGW